MTQRSSPPAVAVIGLACRYPDATSPRQLWENILARRRQFRRIPDCRLPLSDYHDADKAAPDKTYGRQAAVIDGFEFDWAGRRIPWSTVRTTDIVHWLALETSLAAVEDAGFTKDSLPGKRTGVIVGNTLTGEQTRANTMRLRWPFVRRALHAAARDHGMNPDERDQLTRVLKARYTSVFPPVDEDTLAGGLSNTIAGRICNHLDLMGGGFTVDGACASSLLAVAHAASRLVDQDLDLAIVGGVDISLDPFELIGFAKTGALTESDMTVYDRGGDGFIPGEGCGFMVLKTLEAAQRDGHRIYAILHGWGISSDGGGAGITAPSVSGQAMALKRAYLHAPYGIDDLDFIEGHGTGTTVGDRTELEAIARVLGRSPMSRGQLRPCGITSLKSIVGHTKAASGIGGLIKAVMAVNRRVLPPTAACSHPHQAFDSAARRLYPLRQGGRVPGDRQLAAGVSSMGFGGINCHITLASGDPPDQRLAPALDEGVLLEHAQESELLVLGAANRSELLEQLTGLIETTDGISIAEMADLAADLSRQLPSHATVRAAIVAGHPDDLSTRLNQLASALREGDSDLDGDAAVALTPDVWLGNGKASPRIGFLFPGQGSQQFNMARMLVNRFTWAQELVSLADRFTREQIDVSLSRLIYRDIDRAPDPEEKDRWFAELSRTEHAQPAICLASALWFDFFRRLGIHPHVVGGHSLGELNACFAGGVFDVDTLLAFAVGRGQAMSVESGTPGAMVGLRCNEAAARQLIPLTDGYIAVANLNGPRQTVLSGEREAVAHIARIAQENGINARMLPVSNAFHSRLCEDAARQVAAMDLLSEIMPATSCPVFSSIDGKPLAPKISLRDHFSRQIRSRVDFIGMLTAMAPNCDLIVEMGPGRVLTGLVGDILEEAAPICLPVEATAGSASDLNRVLAAMFTHGASVQWEGLYENRLIRPFVPAADKSFVASPCETIPPSDRQDAVGGDLSPGSVPAMLAEAFADVPEALVDRYIESRGAFLTQVVRADLSFWDPDARPADTGLPGPATSAPAREILYRLVSEVTGFTSDTLTPDARLLDDLNLDSIKAGDLVARFAEQCGVVFPDPALLANASLGDLTDAANRLGGAGSPAAADRAQLGRRLVVMASEITGFAPERLDLSMRLLDDLNLDSIKAGDLIARFVDDAGSATATDMPTLTNASLSEVVDLVAADLDVTAGDTPTPDVLSVLMDQAAKITGFSGDALDPDLPVESGLHLGLDKLASLVHRTTSVLGIQAHLDVDRLLTRSLQQIGVILNRMRSEQRDTGPVAVAGAGDTSTWVRDFCIDLVPDRYPQLPETWGMRSEDDWQKARVLIVHGPDTGDVAELLSQRLLQRGAIVEASDFDAATAAGHAQDASFSHLVAILPKDEQRDGDHAAWLQRLIATRSSIVSPPPAAQGPRRRTTVAWIQFGGGFFGRELRFARPERCAGVALGASIHLERTDLRVRVVDFDPALPAEAVVNETLAELTTPDSFAAIGYDLDRTRRRFGPRLLKPASFVKRELKWSAADVILVTGGAKGITAACALAVARATGVRMALVGRTPHPDQDGQTAASSEIRELLDRYDQLDLTAAYFSCDMADGRAVEAMLAAVTARFGPVTGVIHGAGLNRPRLTGQVPNPQAFSETAPKVLGLLHILDGLQEQPPKLAIGMGSIIGITGMPGNGWYGFSNEVMDLALRRFATQHPETQILDVAYSIWRDEGMGARMGSVDHLRDKGIDAIPTDEGVARFLNLFTHDPGHRQVVVTARMGGLDTWPQELPEVPSGLRFLETPTHLTPGVEAIFSAHLTLESDPYLRDHDFQGSYLFPTVFGLEAMTQAALCLTGQTQVSGLQIRDVQLLRPITVDPESGADIIIRAILAESPHGAAPVVYASIVKAGTGIQSDYFSATLDFGATGSVARPPVAPSDTPLPLAPGTDLYRDSLLFQGPRFQGIETIWDMRTTGDESGTAMFTSRLTAADQLPALAFGDPAEHRLCLGDAFFTDTLLQSAALLVPQDTSLPVSIGRLDLFPAFFRATKPAIVPVELVGREDRDLIYRVVAADDNGAPRAVLEEYRLRILKHHDDFPSVGDLISPAKRDGLLLGRALAEASQVLSLEYPWLETDCIPEIHDMPKPARHEAEGPLLKKALTHAAEQYELPAASLTVEWLDSGKPVVAGVAPAELDISLSHEDRTCLCVCGPGPVGCDLSAITQRTKERWIRLLGDHHRELLEQLIGRQESLDSAGTRIWAAMEALSKAAGQTGGELQLAREAGDAMLLIGHDTAQGAIQILTLPIRLTWGPPMIVAVSVVDKTVPRVPDHLLTADYPGYEPLYQTRPFEMIEDGPQGQLVFVQRLPVTFQPSANLSRTIYFSNFIKWMGNTREASAWPVLAEMSEQFASGRWGGVTNYGHLKILGEGGTSDQIEILMWVSDNSGPENSTMTLSYDFRKMLNGGGYERLAFCRLQTTWVEILGPGVAKVAPYPPYYGQFIEDMCPRSDAPDVPEPLPESLVHLFDNSGDAPVFRAASGPVIQPIVRGQTFETTLAHANLVGNIYYANYYEWQGQIRDRFFYELIPEYFGGIGEKGELVALESRVDHLREAMPFDRIKLTMAVKELRDCNVTFHLDYFREEPDGSPVKIAHGLHRAAWIRRDGQGRPLATPFPDPVRAAFDAAISDKG